MTLKTKKTLIKTYKSYQYRLKTIFLTILLWPIVVFFSKKAIAAFVTYCFGYQRDGIIKLKNGQSVSFNSFAHYEADIKIKQLDRHGYLVNFNQENFCEFIIKNNQHQPISCLIVLQKKPTTKWVIGFHGWTENKYLALRLVTWFYQRGYNILTFDSMAHGLSYGEYTDIGLTTSQDVNCLINWLTKHYEVSELGLIGNSMGASTINYYLTHYYQQQKTKVNWAVTDCGFLNLMVQMRYTMQNKSSKPWWLISYRLAQKYQKYSNSNISHYDFKKELTKQPFLVPNLVIHGTADLFVPFFTAVMIDNIATKNGNQNYFSLFNNDVGHVGSLPNAYEIYCEALTNFINQHQTNKNKLE